ncbi:MAG: HdeA/HdeB family chaperone [Caulobacteraceae bacterium]
MLLAIVALAGAGSSTTAAPHPNTMTCRDFLSLDDVTRPRIVHWAKGVKHKGRPEDAVIDVGATNRLAPIIVQQCKVTPKASF